MTVFFVIAENKDTSAALQVKLILLHLFMAVPAAVWGQRSGNSCL